MQPNQKQQPTPQDTFLSAKGAYRVGDYTEAAKYSGLLRAHFPDHPPVLAIHGMILSRLGLDLPALPDLARAADLTEDALVNGDDQNPARPQIIDQLFQVCVAWCNSLVRTGEPGEGIEVIDRALVYDPERHDAIAAKAEALAAMGDHSGAQKLINDHLSNAFDRIRLTISLGRIELLGEGKPDSGVIAAVRDQTDRVGLNASDLMDALRVLGDLEDRAGDYDNAFSAYRRAANLRRGRFDPEAHAQLTNTLIQNWTADEMAKLVKSDADGSPMVLLLGAPCSGVEELAALLDQAGTVSTVGPIDAMMLVAKKVFGARSGVIRPVVFSPKGLRGKQFTDGAGVYGSSLMPFVRPGANRAIDTNEMNLWLAGIAALILPGIKIVFCRRDPRDSALDCYTADLPGLHPYAKDLVHAGSYIADCNRMMDHWTRVLADERIGCEVHEVQYADLLADPIACAQKVVGMIGGEGADSITKIHRSLRKSPDPKHYKSKMHAVDELFDEISAGA
ncbi:MAG: sulfotransferase [Phycisphaerales bacterium]|nr:sulfotransferase [Phycisphaerales bacterium]